MTPKSTPERDIIVPNTVYVREVHEDELPDELLAQGGPIAAWSVHAPDGQRLAIVRDKKLAFILARQHDYNPVYVN